MRAQVLSAAYDGTILPSPLHFGDTVSDKVCYVPQMALKKHLKPLPKPSAAWQCWGVQSEGWILSRLLHYLVDAIIDPIACPLQGNHLIVGELD